MEIGDLAAVVALATCGDDGPGRTSPSRNSVLAGTVSMSVEPAYVGLRRDDARMSDSGDHADDREP